MTAPFSHLLLATEHTEFDSGAEQLALALAQHFGLRLSAVLPLVSNPEFEALAPQIAARAEQDAALKLARLRDLAGQASVPIELQVRRGEEPYREIVDAATELGSDLIVIRRRGKRGMLANLLVGEMVTKVVAHAPCDVLIAPTGARLWSRRILVAAQPTVLGRRLVASAAAVARASGLPLCILCVDTGNAREQRVPLEAFLGASLELAQELGVSAQGHAPAGRAAVEILASAATLEADLIVIGNRSDHSIRRALVGGVAQKVIGLAPTPVLVLHCAAPTA